MTLNIKKKPFATSGRVSVGIKKPAYDQLRSISRQHEATLSDTLDAIIAKCYKEMKE
jgi:hypothetical protein